MIKEIVDYWNSKEGKPWHRCKKITPAVSHILDHELDGFDPADIKSAIDNYHTLLTGESYYWTYKWNISRFFSVTDSRRGNNHIKKWWQFLPESFEIERYYDKKVVNKMVHERAVQDKKDRQRDKDRDEYSGWLKEADDAEYDNYVSQFGHHLDWLRTELKCPKKSDS